MSQAATKKKKRLGREELTLNLMILPGLIILIIFVFAIWKTKDELEIAQTYPLGL